MDKTGDSIPEERIAANLKRVRARINEAELESFRSETATERIRLPGTTTLVGVTKYSTAGETAALMRLGVIDFGESRVQDAEKKIAVLPDPWLRWHLIGHLQTNKAAKAVRLFHTIHSI